MLFSYTYVSHQMEKMQEFIDFIFYEVWCKAPGNGVFRLDLFNGNPELKEVMVIVNYGDTKGGDFFYSHVEGIYNSFAELSLAQIVQFQEWYQANNSIEKICANDPAIQIARYVEIKASHPELNKQLASFFKELYSQDLLGLAELRKRIGDIDDHYEAFIQSNKNGKCPFCGINDIKGIHHTKREAYDHYFPKALYPFNTINLRNLAPTCNECNSVRKQMKDPASNAAGRRKAFYPYANSGPKIELKIDLTNQDIDKLGPTDIELTFRPSVISEEIETWKDLYGIEERYKAKCCGENDGKYWFAQALDEWKENGRQPAEFLDTLARLAAKYPLADSNFLKKAFLDACNRRGLFTET